MTVRERNIQLPMAEIESFCHRYPIRKLSLFGSVLRDDFQDHSDIDFLVELAADAQIGLFKLMEMQFELETLLNRKVDLRTIHNFPRRLQKHVLDSAETVYVRE